MTAPARASGWDRRRAVLLSEYERIALELFATHGFKNVTFDAIADVAGVSARTLYRYFPTKEDFLLGHPRRGTSAMVERINALEPSKTPLQTAWRLIGECLMEHPAVEDMTLWRQAAVDAPEIHAQVRGERTQALLDALTEYAARSLGPIKSRDVRATLIAGVVAGAELAAIELYGRSELDMPEILEIADALLLGLDVTVRDVATRSVARSRRAR